MKCPIDATDLLMTDRQGVEIDYCPTCRGVWLDRGELDKLVERGADHTGPAMPPPGRAYQPDSHHASRKHKREGFLGEIFDF